MIENLKELEKLLKLCRKQGVIEIKLGTIEFKLGDLPQEGSSQLNLLDEQVDPYANFPQRELTSDELAIYANGGSINEN